MEGESKDKRSSWRVTKNMNFLRKCRDPTVAEAITLSEGSLGGGEA